MAKDKAPDGPHQGDPAIRPCKCKHEYQDKTLGRGLRWKKWAKAKRQYRCTVCGSLD